VIAIRWSFFEDSLLSLSRRSASLSAGAYVLPDAQFPRSAQSTGQHILARLSQSYMGHSHPAPPTGNGQEKFRLVPNERRLLFRREHQITVAMGLRRERGENSPADTEIGRTHVRTFFDPLKTQGNAAKILGFHGTT
jgi:hypothetical protein